MENQEFKSKWDELARDLGAEVSPEAEQRDRDTAESEPAKTAQPKIAERSTDSTPSPPKRSPADWSKLAGDLGLQPTQSAESEEKEEASTSQSTEQPSQVPFAERPQSSDRDTREPRDPQPGSDGRRDRSTERRRERRDDVTERRSRPTRDRPDRPRSGRPRSDNKRPQREATRPESAERKRKERESAGDEGEFGSETPPAPKPQPQEETPKPAAVSLWHKIFGAPAEQAEQSFGEPKPAAPDDRFERQEARDRTESADPYRSLSGEEVAEAGLLGETERERDSDSQAESSESEEQRRSRPRRRRRGGRGRKPGERRRIPADEEDSDRNERALEDDFDELGETESNGDDDDTLSNDDSQESPNGVGGSRKRKEQRSIPSWNEAIGYIVETNLQGRSQRRPASRTDARGGSSRGRSRGRRKR